MENRNLPLAPRSAQSFSAPVTGPVAGIDLGDRKSEVCVYSQGVILERFQFEMTVSGLRAAFVGKGYSRIAMEAGAQSPWVTRELRALGYEPLVANPRKLKAISSNERKSDRNDAFLLARLAAADASLLYPIHHRSAERADALAVLTARHCAVVGRARLIHTIRALAKSMGFRFKRTTPDGFDRQKDSTPDALRPAVAPLFELLVAFKAQIKAYDAQLEEMAETHFPETRHLLQVNGVGPVTALAYVLVIEDPTRFPNGRTAAAYFGLVPRRDQSGTTDKQLGISKTGNSFVRRLLVQCAQYILGPHGRDSDLRRWGHKLADRGGKNAKKRAVVATARRLAVLLFRLWRREETWEPLFNAGVQLANSTPSDATSEGLPETAVFDDCAARPDVAPTGANVVRETAASTMVRTPPCTGPLPGPSKSADRSKDTGKPSKKSMKAPSAARRTTRPTGSAPRPVTPSASAEQASAGDSARACAPPDLAVPGVDAGAGQGPSPVRRTMARSSR